jgi:hypothetical protein
MSWAEKATRMLQGIGFDAWCDDYQEEVTRAVAGIIPLDGNFMHVYPNGNVVRVLPRRHVPYIVTLLTVEQVRMFASVMSSEWSET